MIDLDAIEKECQQMIADGLGFIAPKSCGNAEMVASLVEELRKVGKDAKRYRWLRDDANGVQVDGCLQLCGEDWDLAIDRVMKCER